MKSPVFQMLAKQFRLLTHSHQPSMRRLDFPPFCRILVDFPLPAVPHQEMGTGYHLNRGHFASSKAKAKNKNRLVDTSRFLFWQRVKDSNPHIQSQSLLCYPYTNPLCDFVRSEQILLYRYFPVCQAIFAKIFFVFLPFYFVLLLPDICDFPRSFQNKKETARNAAVSFFCFYASSAALSCSTRSVFSQETPRSSRPM